MSVSKNEGKAPTHLARTEMLVGTEPLQRFRKMRIAIFGVGGVGGYVMEALARSGVGTLDLIDNDTVAESNLNRQIIATGENLDKSKVNVAQARIKAIDPDIQVNTYETFYLPEMSGEIPFGEFNYIVDAIDTVSAKIDLVIQAQAHGVPIISAMGCGNRLDPGKLVCTDIYKTQMDPLAKVLRKELRERGVKRLKVVYSTEPPIKPMQAQDDGNYTKKADVKKQRKSVPGSSAFVPGAAGLMIASEVFRDILDL